jgi:hypothetical protein
MFPRLCGWWRRRTVFPPSSHISPSIEAYFLPTVTNGPNAYNVAVLGALSRALLAMRLRVNAKLLP